MCSRGIRFLAEHDPGRRFRFVPLQGTRGRSMEDRAGGNRLATVLVEADGKVVSRSDAVIRILNEMGPGWRLMGAVGAIIPRSMRDAGYDFIAARRHDWFGGGKVCSIPSQELRERLLHDP